MASSSIAKITRTRKARDKRTGEVRDRQVELWQARYRVTPGGRQFTKTMARKTDVENWLQDELARLTTNTWLEPDKRKITVGEWCDQWLEGYGTRRESTVRQARVHVAKIREQFGGVLLAQVRPSHVKSWCAKLAKEDHEPSYVYALHSRLSQILGDAVHDGVLTKNPCSRRTAPPVAEQRAYVATVEQIWALYDAMPARYRIAIYNGAFAGLRAGEQCGLRPGDVAWLQREIRPEVQYPAEPLKTEMSKTPIPIADGHVKALARQVELYPGEWILTDELGGQVGPWKLERAFRTARGKVAGLPDGFRLQDLRHFFASLLIASGADIKVVQHRVRHKSAKTTLDVYGHMFPDKDESTRTAVETVLVDRVEEQLRNRNEGR
ncbi:site-specific integrase [Jiangella rhizosphaerae]|uniref:Site-specific integrase n=1 Tax=Jiangella rhizosphaerae TaxID=2293569 RepID=A0A418KHI2_9ACTN|nr:site-specific integrase [Jiangella rhizosphaerae]RIQ11894.1 site-specific integrase [Jiangella rhizosphaerae]